MRAITVLENAYPEIYAEKMTQRRKSELTWVLDSVDRDTWNQIKEDLWLSMTEEMRMRKNPVWINTKSIEEIWEQVTRIVNNQGKNWENRERASHIDLWNYWRLTKQEQDVLKTLFLFTWKVTPNEVLLQVTKRWTNTIAEAKIVDVLICKIRRKLPDNYPYTIETIWGRWYILVEKEESSNKDRLHSL